MIRHMVLFRFKPGTADEVARAVLDELGALPSQFPTMKRFGLGPNISKRDQTFSHVMTIEFDRREELEAYLDSEAHERFVAARFRPCVEQRAIASYEHP